MSLLRPFVACLALLLAQLALAAPPAMAQEPAPDSVTKVVFGAQLMNHFGAAPEDLLYRFEMSGSTLKEPFVSHVRMKVGALDAGGVRMVDFDMFEGPNRRTFGPMSAREQNPLIIVFLQRDVAQMGNLTGGAANYFQQQIRQAFNLPAEVETVTIDGVEGPARLVRMQPFKNDASIARFPKFRDKTYEFVVADSLPGGLYRITSRVPDPESGEIILEESMIFDHVE